MLGSMPGNLIHQAMATPCLVGINDSLGLFDGASGHRISCELKLAETIFQF